MYERCFIAGQVDRGVRDGVRGAGGARGGAVHHRLGRVRFALGQFRGADDAGGDGVDPHAARPEFGGPGAGERLDRALGGAVERGERDAEAGDPGAEVDDGAAAGLRHRRGERRGEEERRLDVDGVDPVEGLLVGLRRRRAGEDAGVVDEDVDAAAEFPRGLLGQRPTGRRAAVEVGAQEHGPAALRADPLDHRRAARFVAAGDRDERALPAERERDLAADVAGRPGDQGRLVLQACAHDAVRLS